MKCYISHKILGLGRRKSDIVITPPWKCKFAKINDKQSCIRGLAKLFKYTMASCSVGGGWGKGTPLYGPHRHMRS